MFYSKQKEEEGKTKTIEVDTKSGVKDAEPKLSLEATLEKDRVGLIEEESVVYK